MSRRMRPVMLLCLSSVVVVTLVAASADAQRSEGGKATAPSPVAKGDGSRRSGRCAHHEGRRSRRRSLCS